MNKSKKSSKATKVCRQTKSGERSYSGRTLRGFKFSPASNPPDITIQPWFSTVVTKIVTSSLTTSEYALTLGKLTEALYQQLDPKSTCFLQIQEKQKEYVGPSIQLRLQSLSIWNLTGRVIGLSINDVTDEAKDDKDQYGGWIDHGGASWFPALGFQYPASASAEVHRADNSNGPLVLASIMGSPRDSLLYHFKVLWRPDGPIKFDIIQDSMARMVSKIDVSVDDIADKLSALSSKYGDDSSRGSWVSRTIDGVSKLLPLVVTLASGESDDDKITALFRSCVENELFDASKPDN